MRRETKQKKHIGVSVSQRTGLVRFPAGCSLQYADMATRFGR
jgi:hypothetical protein